MSVLQLLTKAIRKRLPLLYTNQGQGHNALAQVKFFLPDFHWTWYATEFDGEDTFFGLVAGDEIELGYFLLSELQTLRGKWGLRVERDRSFKPQFLGPLMDYHLRARD